MALFISEMHSSESRSDDEHLDDGKDEDELDCFAFIFALVFELGTTFRTLARENDFGSAFGAAFEPAEVFKLRKGST